jgi:uncharacterized membrane protein YcaP (DUF421 family)
MDWLYDLDQAMFEPNGSLLEVFLRGTIMYLGLFVLMRVVLKRESGTVGVSDLLVIVLIADAAQNGMAGEYRSITDAFILVGTIIGWNTLVDWLTYRWPRLQKILEPPPLLLVDDGRVLWRHLRHEFMSEQDLKTKLREHGVTDPRQVAKAFMEADGQVTVIKKQ